MGKLLILSLMFSTVVVAGVPTFVASKSRTVYITGPIVMDVASKIIKLSTSKDPIDIIINSSGGELEVSGEVILLMIELKMRGIVFRCFVPSLATNLALVIFSECDERYTSPSAKLMWGPIGINTDLYITRDIAKSILDALAQVEEYINPRLIDRMGISEKDFYKYHKEETVHTASELHKLIPGFFKIVKGEL